jgi:hypothetical protein
VDGRPGVTRDLVREPEAFADQRNCRELAHVPPAADRPGRPVLSSKQVTIAGEVRAIEADRLILLTRTVLHIPLGLHVYPGSSDANRFEVDGRKYAAGMRQANQSRAAAAEVRGSHQLQTGARSRPRIEHGVRNGVPVTCCICWGPGRTPFFNQFMTARSRLLR